MINKREFKKVNDKKILHKIGKQWVTISLSTLMLIGGSSVIASANQNQETSTQTAPKLTSNTNINNTRTNQASINFQSITNKSVNNSTEDNNSQAQNTTTGRIFRAKHTHPSSYPTPQYSHKFGYRFTFNLNDGNGKTVPYMAIGHPNQNIKLPNGDNIQYKVDNHRHVHIEDMNGRPLINTDIQKLEQNPIPRSFYANQKNFKSYNTNPLLQFMYNDHTPISNYRNVADNNGILQSSGQGYIKGFKGEIVHIPINLIDGMQQDGTNSLYPNFKPNVSDLPYDYQKHTHYIPVVLGAGDNSNDNDINSNYWPKGDTLHMITPRIYYKVNYHLPNGQIVTTYKNSGQINQEINILKNFKKQNFQNTKQQISNYYNLNPTSIREDGNRVSSGIKLSPKYNNQETPETIDVNLVPKNYWENIPIELINKDTKKHTDYNNGDFPQKIDAHVVVGNAMGSNNQIPIDPSNIYTNGLNPLNSRAIISTGLLNIKQGENNKNEYAPDNYTISGAQTIGTSIDKTNGKLEIFYTDKTQASNYKQWPQLLYDARDWTVVNRNASTVARYIHNYVQPDNVDDRNNLSAYDRTEDRYKNTQSKDPSAINYNSNINWRINTPSTAPYNSIATLSPWNDKGFKGESYNKTFNVQLTKTGVRLLQNASINGDKGILYKVNGQPHVAHNVGFAGQQAGNQVAYQITSGINKGKVVNTKPKDNYIGGYIINPNHTTGVENSVFLPQNTTILMDDNNNYLVYDYQNHRYYEPRKSSDNIDTADTSKAVNFQPLTKEPAYNASDNSYYLGSFNEFAQPKQYTLNLMDTGDYIYYGGTINNNNNTNTFTAGAPNSTKVLTENGTPATTTFTSFANDILSLDGNMINLHTLNQTLPIAKIPSNRVYDSGFQNDYDQYVYNQNILSNPNINLMPTPTTWQLDCNGSIDPIGANNQANTINLYTADDQIKSQSKVIFIDSANDSEIGAKTSNDKTVLLTPQGKTYNFDLQSYLRRIDNNLNKSKYGTDTLQIPLNKNAKKNIYVSYISVPPVTEGNSITYVFLSNFDINNPNNKGNKRGNIRINYVDNTGKPVQAPINLTGIYGQTTLNDALNNQNGGINQSNRGLWNYNTHNFKPLGIQLGDFESNNQYTSTNNLTNLTNNTIFNSLYTPSYINKAQIQNTGLFGLVPQVTVVLQPQPRQIKINYIDEDSHHILQTDTRTVYSYYDNPSQQRKQDNLYPYQYNPESTLQKYNSKYKIDYIRSTYPKLNKNGNNNYNYNLPINYNNQYNDFSQPETFTIYLVQKNTEQSRSAELNENISYSFAASQYNVSAPSSVPSNYSHSAKYYQLQFNDKPTNWIRDPQNSFSTVNTPSIKGWHADKSVITSPYQNSYGTNSLPTNQSYTVTYYPDSYYDKSSATDNIHYIYKDGNQQRGTSDSSNGKIEYQRLEKWSDSNNPSQYTAGQWLASAIFNNIASPSKFINYQNQHYYLSSANTTAPTESAIVSNLNKNISTSYTNNIIYTSDSSNATNQSASVTNQAKIIYENSTGSIVGSSDSDDTVNYSRTKYSDINNPKYSSATSWSANQSFQPVAANSYITSGGLNYHLIQSNTTLPSINTGSLSNNYSSKATQDSLIYQEDSYTTSTQSASAVENIAYNLSSTSGSINVSNYQQAIRYNRTATIDDNNPAKNSYSKWTTKSHFGPLPSSYSNANWHPVASNISTPNINTNSLSPTTPESFNYYVNYASDIKSNGMDYATVTDTVKYYTSNPSVTLSKATNTITYSRADSINWSINERSYGSWTTSSAFTSISTPQHFLNQGGQLNNYHLMSANTKLPTINTTSLRNGTNLSFTNNISYASDSYSNSAQNATVNEITKYHFANSISSSNNTITYNRNVKYDTNNNNSLVNSTAWSSSGSLASISAPKLINSNSKTWNYISQSGSFPTSISAGTNQNYTANVYYATTRNHTINYINESNNNTIKTITITGHTNTRPTTANYTTADIPTGFVYDQELTNKKNGNDYLSKVTYDGRTTNIYVYQPAKPITIKYIYQGKDMGHTVRLNGTKVGDAIPSLAQYQSNNYIKNQFGDYKYLNISQNVHQFTNRPQTITIALAKAIGIVNVRYIDTNNHQIISERVYQGNANTDFSYNDADTHIPHGYKFVNNGENVKYSDSLTPTNTDIFIKRIRRNPSPNIPPRINPINPSPAPQPKPNPKPKPNHNNNNNKGHNHNNNNNITPNHEPNHPKNTPSNRNKNNNIPRIHNPDNINYIKPNHTVKYGKYKIQRIQQKSLYWFYIIHPCLAHNHLLNVGYIKDYDYKLKPHQTLFYHINRIFIIKRRYHRPKVRFEFRTNFGHGMKNYFVTGNRFFTRNAYVQPQQYHIKQTLRVIHNCKLYKSKYYNNSTFIRNVHTGEEFRIKKLKKIGYDHQTRFLLTNGRYITANKNFVKVKK